MPVAAGAKWAKASKNKAAGGAAGSTQQQQQQRGCSSKGRKPRSSLDDFIVDDSDEGEEGDGDTSDASDAGSSSQAEEGDEERSSDSDGAGSSSSRGGGGAGGSRRAAAVKQVLDQGYSREFEAWAGAGADVEALLLQDLAGAGAGAEASCKVRVGRVGGWVWVEGSQDRASWDPFQVLTVLLGLDLLLLPYCCWPLLSQPCTPSPLCLSSRLAVSLLCQLQSPGALSPLTVFCALLPHITSCPAGAALDPSWTM